VTGGGRQGRTGSKIRDVAKQAGVSVGTVSHVLNRPEIVRPDLRERVLRVIEELDYRPNAVAKSLRLRRTMTIALVLSDITTPFASAVARAVQDRAATTGMSVLFADTDEDPAREALAVRTFYDKGVDGLILAPTAGGHRFLEPYMAGGWPMVAINRRPEGVRLPAVLSDNTGGAAAATRHLLDHGHRRIGVVTRRDPLSSVQDRLEGYRRALLAAGTRPDPALVVEETASLEGGASAVSSLLVKLAPVSTPTPRRVTSSPPSHEVTAESRQPAKEMAMASICGLVGLSVRSSQLPANRPTTSRFPSPWIAPTDLARVFAGIASQSIKPKTAASSPPIRPAAIIQ
jgi:LacI family transcriptional regulator